MYGAAHALQPVQFTPPHCDHCEATQPPPPVAELAADELVLVLLVVMAVVEVVVATVLEVLLEVVLVLKVVETGLVVLLGPGSGTESAVC